ncbi:MAG: chemotaxis protein CheA [Nitrospirae bacterium]|nr:chemotaxis protein CheA [Nitrospirota bacterium]
MENNLTHLTDKEFESLRASFFQQSFEILEVLSEEILRFENNPDDEEALKNIQRYVHTLKGDSASMGLNNLSDTAHRLEDILHLLREKSLQMDRDVADLIFSCVDIFTQILKNDKEENHSAVDTQHLIERIDSYLDAGSNPSCPPFLKGREGGLASKRGMGDLLTEYQQLQVETALKNGLSVYEIKIVFDSQCSERAVGAFMINNQLSTLGEIILWMPDIEDEGIETVDEIKAFFSTRANKDIFEKSCKLAGVTGAVDISLISLAGAGLRASHDAGQPQGVALTKIFHHNTTLRVDAKKIDEIIDLVGELIIGRSMLTQSVYELNERLGKEEAVSKLENVNSLFERSLSELQKNVMTVRMVPVDHVMRRFPRIVRDLSIEKRKEIKLELHGADTELDKGIVDVIGEPLMHLLRNSIDHGIELPEEREKKGKDRCGVIKINSYHEGGQIIIEMSDDGKGINIDKLKLKAVEKEIIKEEDAAKMPDEEALDLIFHSGLSTADEVTETSGRGIGMDAVKRTVEELKGLIQVRSMPDKGAKFIIRLPLTLAIIQGMVFKAGEEFFAFPLSSILEIRRVFKDEINTINGMESLKWRERIISLIRLKEIIDSCAIGKERLLRFSRNDKQVASNDIQYGHCEERSDEAISEDKGKSFVLIIGLAEKSSAF